MTQNYKKYMRRCIDLARNGKGRAAPNPMVGSVIVHNNEIIGEGYHEYFGGPHAEVNAINSVVNKNLLSKSTLYVNLEPCSHTGKTPPCSDLIVENKLKEVVIGSIDPNSLVAGKGIAKLESAGIKVVSDILLDECNDLNKRFFTFHREKRPYIILKWAESNDGYLDIDRIAGTAIGPNWISNTLSRMLVHKWRSVETGIMVGTNTVFYDDPGLNTRLWPGNSPTRVILDREGRINKDAKVFDGRVPTLVFTGLKKPNEINLKYIQIDFSSDILPQVLKSLYELEISSLMVEGGKELLQSFINSGLWDEARVFKGQTNFKSGIPAPQLNASSKSLKQILDDSLIIYTK